MLTISLTAQALFLLAALVISARATLRTGSILRGGLYLYGLLVLEVVLFSIVLPALLMAYGADRHEVVNSFPEEIGVLPVILLCWIHGFVFAALVRGVQVAARKIFAPRSR